MAITAITTTITQHTERWGYTQKSDSYNNPFNIHVLCHVVRFSTPAKCKAKHHITAAWLHTEISFWQTSQGFQSNSVSTSHKKSQKRRGVGFTVTGYCHVTEMRHSVPPVTCRNLNATYVTVKRAAKGCKLLWNFGHTSPINTATPWRL
jgi:hypothetical protein